MSKTERATVLPDVLAPGLRVVFCGTAAGRKSAESGFYYAGPANKFWRTLAETGLTPRLLQPCEFRELPRFGLGLTDTAKHSSGSDNNVPEEDHDVPGFLTKMRQFSPRVVAFNGLKPARLVFGRKVHGYGKRPERIGDAVVFVLPSTSSAANGPWSISYWQQLADFVG